MTTSTESRQTPLHSRHLERCGAMVDFGGYAMPQQYTGIRDEHIAVRERVGIFDISHMGEVTLRGPGAATTVERLCANHVGRLVDGQALYGVMCNEVGGIVDDIIVYRDAADDYMVVINAACHDADVAWITAHLEPDTAFADISDHAALLAVQGPRAVELVNSLAASDVSGVAPFHRVFTDVAGVPARVSRTGYTGEDGFELYVLNQHVTQLWDAILEAGAQYDIRPCGLGARDTLRLEAGLRLYGQDMDIDVDPLSAGLAWTLKLQKPTPCIGHDALVRIKAEGPPRVFAGIALEGRAIARHGQTVHSDGVECGVVTSGTFSFSLGHGIATASLNADIAADAPLSVDIRGTLTPVTRTPLPFYRRPA